MWSCRHGMRHRGLEIPSRTPPLETPPLNTTYEHHPRDALQCHRDPIIIDLRTRARDTESPPLECCSEPVPDGSRSHRLKLAWAVLDLTVRTTGDSGGCRAPCFFPKCFLLSPSPASSSEGRPSTIFLPVRGLVGVKSRIVSSSSTRGGFTTFVTKPSDSCGWASAPGPKPKRLRVWSSSGQSRIALVSACTWGAPCSDSG